MDLRNELLFQINYVAWQLAVNERAIYIKIIIPTLRNKMVEHYDLNLRMMGCIPMSLAITSWLAYYPKRC